jgi:hypothetical protein
MAKLINNTGLKGPYSGRTYEEEAKACKHSLFAYSVIRKIDDNLCNYCMKPCSPDYTYCSKKCATKSRCEREAVLE